MSTKVDKKATIQLLVNTILGQSIDIDLMDKEAHIANSGQDYFALCGSINGPNIAPSTVSVSSVFCFTGLELDEALSCLLFALGPGDLRNFLFFQSAEFMKNS